MMVLGVSHISVGGGLRLAPPPSCASFIYRVMIRDPLLPSGREDVPQHSTRTVIMALNTHVLRTRALLSQVPSPRARMSEGLFLGQGPGLLATVLQTQL